MKHKNKAERKEKFNKVVKTAGAITKAAIMKGTPAGIIASEIIARNPKTKARVETYIKKAGLKPHPHAVGKAIQVSQIRDEKTEDLSRKMQEEETASDPDMIPAPMPEHEEVEEMLMNNEEEEASASDEPDNFIDPATLAMVSKAAKQGIEMINKKRQAAGKPPIFTGAKLKSAIEKKLGGKSTGDPAADAAIAAALKENGLLDAANAGKETYIAESKKAEFTKMLPMIIGAAVVLIVVGYFVAKKK